MIEVFTQYSDIGCITIITDVTAIGRHKPSPRSDAVTASTPVTAITR
jgi:hypothetical protein